MSNHSFCHRLRCASSALLVLAGAGCQTGRGSVRLPSAADVVGGHAAGEVAADTVSDTATVGVTRARRTFRSRADEPHGFWEDIAVLDMPGAQRAAHTVDERTFVMALGFLMASDPERAVVAFGALHNTATDAVVRASARSGLTMALSWHGDWSALASIAADPNLFEADSSDARKSLERWSQVLSTVPAPEFFVQDAAVTLPLRMSSFGTPVVTVRVNGHPHEFWLDTGASMTLISARVARGAGVTLLAVDTLALGVVGGQIPARAINIDSLSIGPVRALGLGAALVSATELRLDQRVVNGVAESVPIDGVIGMDVLRHLDVMLDASAGTITIRRPRPNPRAVRNLFGVGYPVVRLVASDGRPVLFGLDTGAEFSYVTLALLRKLPATPVAMRRRTIGGLGTTRLTTEWVARKLSLSDGDYAIALGNVPVMPELSWTFVTFDGMLGSDVVLSARLHLDFVNGIFEARKSAALSGTPGDAVGHR